MSSNNPNRSRVNVIDVLQKLADGLTKHASTVPTFIVAGTALKPSDVTAKIQAWITLARAIASAKAAWQAAVASEKAAAGQLQPVVLAVKHALRSAYSNQGDLLADFGLTPPRKPVVSPATRTAAALKAKATRAARGTKGRVQRQAITTHVTIAPATTTSVAVEGAGAAAAPVSSAGAAPPTAGSAAPPIGSGAPAPSAAAPPRPVAT